MTVAAARDLAPTASPAHDRRLSRAGAPVPAGVVLPCPVAKHIEPSIGGRPVARDGEDSPS